MPKPTLERSTEGRPGITATSGDTAWFVRICRVSHSLGFRFSKSLLERAGFRHGDTLAVRVIERGSILVELVPRDQILAGALCPWVDGKPHGVPPTRAEEEASEKCI